MKLLPGNCEITQGAIRFKGEELTDLPANQMRKLRGNEISMIFQEPMTALNPVFTVGFQICEPLRVHDRLTKKQAHERGVELLKQVGIPLPEKRMKQYVHELSGGMRQRVMIAIALACRPSLLIADEPTTALDVTIQAQILDLINDLKEQLNMGVIMITHDMGVVAEVADRVMVMYAGKVVEQGDVETIFNHPRHPYTKGLLNSVPNVDDADFIAEPIPGSLPKLNEDIAGCRFHPRCQFALDKCRSVQPKTFRASDVHTVSCWLEEAGS